MSEWGEIRSILEQPPSEESWKQLCDTLLAQEDGPSEELLTYCLAKLESWPHTIARDGTDIMIHLTCGDDRVPVTLANQIGPLVELGYGTPDPFSHIDCQSLCAFLQEQDLSSIQHLAISLTENATDASLKLGDELLKMLAKKDLPRLSSLSLRFNKITSQGALALASSTAFSKLEFLDLRSCFDSWDEDAKKAIALICGSEQLRGLKRLWFGEDVVSNMVAELAGSKSLGNLEELVLEDVDIGADEAALLAASPNTSGLKRLTLRNEPYKGLLREIASAIEDEGAKALASSPYLTQLETLDLAFQNIGDEGVSALATSKNMEHLKVLHLESNIVGSVGAAALAGSPYLTNLHTLCLDSCRYDFEESNWLGDEGVMALANSPSFGKLTHLSLRGVGATAKGFLALMCSEQLSGLQKVDWAKNNVANLGEVGVLGDMKNSLKELHLYESGVGDQGCAALSSWRFDRLTHLTLGANNITHEGLMSLLTGCLCETLEFLMLHGNLVEDAGAIALASSKTLRRLEVLDLSSCKLGDEGALALANSPHLGNLTFLHLGWNNVSDEVQRVLQDRFSSQGATVSFEGWSYFRR